MPALGTQEWIGYVEAVEDDTFTAVLTDVTNGSEPDAVAVFPISSLSGTDCDHLDEGIYLRWVLTPDAMHPDRMESKVTLILDRWTAEDIADAERRAREFADGIAWD